MRTQLTERDVKELVALHDAALVVSGRIERHIWALLEDMSKVGGGEGFRAWHEINGQELDDLQAVRAAAYDAMKPVLVLLQSAGYDTSKLPQLR